MTLIEIRANLDMLREARLTLSYTVSLSMYQREDMSEIMDRIDKLIAELSQDELTNEVST